MSEVFLWRAEVAVPPEHRSSTDSSTRLGWLCSTRVSLTKAGADSDSTLGGVAAWLPGSQADSLTGSAAAAVTQRHLTSLDIGTLICTRTGCSHGSPSSESLCEASPVSNRSCLQPFSCWEAWSLLQTEECTFLCYLSFFPLKKVNTLVFQWSEESWKLFLSAFRMRKFVWIIKICPEPNSAVLAYW